MSRLTDSALAPGRVLEALALLPHTLDKLLAVIGDLHAEMRKMNKEVVAMRKGVDVLGKRVEHLEAEFAATREAVVGMTTDVKSMSGDVHELVPAIDGLREDLGRLPFVGRGRRRGNGVATAQEAEDLSDPGLDPTTPDVPAAEGGPPAPVE